MKGIDEINPYNGREIKRYFIEKCVVMRVKIKSKDPRKFFYFEFENKNYFFARHRHNQLTAKQIYEDIKKRKFLYEKLSDKNLEDIK